jgi:hypothetical protein
VNGRKAKERRRAEAPRVETRPVHRTRPLTDPDGRMVGHGCGCCGRVWTVGGRLSQPKRLREDGITVAPSKSHQRRVRALRNSKGLRGLVRGLRNDAA